MQHIIDEFVLSRFTDRMVSFKYLQLTEITELLEKLLSKHRSHEPMMIIIGYQIKIGIRYAFGADRRPLKFNESEFALLNKIVRLTNDIALLRALDELERIGPGCHVPDSLMDIVEETQDEMDVLDMEQFDDEVDYDNNYVIYNETTVVGYTTEQNPFIGFTTTCHAMVKNHDRDEDVRLYGEREFRLLIKFIEQRFSKTRSAGKFPQEKTTETAEEAAHRHLLLDLGLSNFPDYLNKFQIDQALRDKYKLKPTFIVRLKIVNKPAKGWLNALVVSYEPLMSKREEPFLPIVNDYFGISPFEYQFLDWYVQVLRLDKICFGLDNKDSE